ncbi:hypothetical protein JHK86_052621 [Glycine max]|nr:hypothetical protein JHK86_052621 [Glycine max]
MKHYVYELSSIDDFVIEWRSFTEKFGLLLNEWLSVLFQEYQRWIPFFLKIDFWAGMSTIQRSESLNAFFDGYINTIMILQQFVKQYENALQDNVEKEYEVDFASMNTIIPCESKLLIERQFQVEYIHPKFHEVQAAFRGKINLRKVTRQRRKGEKSNLERVIGSRAGSLKLQKPKDEPSKPEKSLVLFECCFAWMLWKLERIDGDPVLRETRIWATWEYVSSVGGGQQGMWYLEICRGGQETLGTSGGVLLPKTKLDQSRPNPGIVGQ